jgi:hypothetical protein
MRKFSMIVAAGLLAASALGGAAQAAVTVVTPTSGGWNNLPFESRLGATAEITDTAARSGNGSLELTGDRTRFATGAIYPNAASTKLYDLSDVSSLTFDWMIAPGSTNPYNADYTPALRLHIFDAGSNSRKELIWEGAYNGVYGAQTNPGNWYTSGVNDKFYITGGNVNQGKTIADWASFLDTGSFVAGISVGNGSGAGIGYHAFADNVTIATLNGSTTYNFETGVVPEPATWAMLITGFGAVGFSMRRRKAASATALA